MGHVETGDIPAPQVHTAQCYHRLHVGNVVYGPRGDRGYTGAAGSHCSMLSPFTRRQCGPKTTTMFLSYRGKPIIGFYT